MMTKLTLFFLFLLLVSCAKKAEDPQKETPPPARQASVNLPLSFKESFDRWKESPTKECSFSHIFFGSRSYLPHFDQEIIRPIIKSWLSQRKTDNPHKIILHPNWDQAGLTSESYFEERRIQEQTVQISLKDGQCQILINDQEAYSVKLITSIPLLYAFNTQDFKETNIAAIQYHLKDFKDFDSARKELETYEGFDQFDRLIEKEFLLNRPMNNNYCRRGGSLFTLVADDLQVRQTRCLFDFHLRTLGINLEGNFSYQIQNDNRALNYKVKLGLPSHEKMPETKELEELMLDHSFEDSFGSFYQYQLQTINNCHFLVEVKSSYRQLTDQFDLLLNKPELIFRYFSRRNNNLIVVDFDGKGSANLVIRFTKKKRAKKFLKKMQALKNQCLPSL